MNTTIIRSDRLKRVIYDIIKEIKSGEETAGNSSADISDLEKLIANPDVAFAEKNYGSVSVYKKMLRSKIEKLRNNLVESDNDVQSKKIAELERQGYKFLNWIDAHPDADGGSMDDKKTAVMAKRGATKYGREYREVEPDGTVNEGVSNSISKSKSGIVESDNDVQSKKIAELERQGYKFLNWIDAHPDADGGSMDDQKTAVMAKRGATKYGREYREVEPDGTVNEGLSNNNNKLKLVKIIKEVIASEMLMNEDLFSKVHAIPLDQFVSQELDEVDMLGAKTKPLTPDEMQAYLQKTVTGKKTKLDKYTMPYVHRGNVVIKDENDRTFDLDKLKAAITQRPERILKQNEKITHSGGDSTVYFNVGLPALKGLAFNEKTGQFVVVDTCPGAGACKVYCYAKKGGYVQWKASSMSQTRLLNFLLNDPQGFKAKLESELSSAASKFEKKNTKLVVRWHDAGDFFSPDYVDLAYSVARDFPDIDFYSYTKVAGVALGSKPSNFKMSFSMGATPDQERQVNIKSTKHSTVVPKQMFTDLILKDESGKLIKVDGKMQFKSSEDLDVLKNKLAIKYGVSKDSVITYDEMMKIPVDDAPKWNVIVKPGDGDDSANRADVIGTWLLIH